MKLVDMIDFQSCASAYRFDSDHPHSFEKPIMKKIAINVYQWIGEDYRSHPIRFAIEILAWALSIGGAILFALTVPNVPFILYLTITVTGCALYAWAAYSRQSFGMLANYLLLTTIDGYALSRVLL